MSALLERLTTRASNEQCRNVLNHRDRITGTGQVRVSGKKSPAGSHDKVAFPAGWCFIGTTHFDGVRTMASTPWTRLFKRLALDCTPIDRSKRSVSLVRITLHEVPRPPIRQTDALSSVTKQTADWKFQFGTSWRSCFRLLGVAEALS